VAPEAEGSSPFTHPIEYKYCMIYKAPVAQLDRVADFESVGRRFESYRAYQTLEKRIHGPLAQLVEQLTLNQ
jgi:hypothetical protein